MSCPSGIGGKRSAVESTIARSGRGKPRGKVDPDPARNANSCKATRSASARRTTSTSDLLARAVGTLNVSRESVGCARADAEGAPQPGTPNRATSSARPAVAASPQPTRRRRRAATIPAAARRPTAAPVSGRAAANGAVHQNGSGGRYADAYPSPKATSSPPPRHPNATRKTQTFTGTMTARTEGQATPPHREGRVVQVDSATSTGGSAPSAGRESSCAADSMAWTNRARPASTQRRKRSALWR